MREAFFDYYAPSLEDYNLLWKNAAFIFDTNVLLNPYRLPAVAREELLKVLELLKDRVWIPHQVALEFQRRRLTVISAERKSTEEALSLAQDMVVKIREKVLALQIDKAGIGIEPTPLLNELEQANNKLVEAIQAVQKTQLDISASDPIRDRLDTIFAGKVGAGPKTQEDLDQLIASGDQRFIDLIPPGFADAGKDKNPNEAVFIHNGLKYQRKFGDLILWRQVMAHVRDKGIRQVILVTAEKKEDWWWQEKGKTLGPHAELIREMRCEGSVELFWMYSLDQFLEHAKTHTKAKISPETVAEVQEASRAAILFRRSMDGRFERVVREKSEPNPRASKLYDQSSYNAEAAVYDWLADEYGEIYSSDEFPSFLRFVDDERHGYEIKILKEEDGILGGEVRLNLERGAELLKSGDLTSFTMILGLDVCARNEIITPRYQSHLRSRAREVLSLIPVTGITFGFVSNGKFLPILRQRR